MSIGENVKTKRVALGISQAQLAREVGVTAPMMNQIERGTKTLSLPLAKEIADVLKCGVEDLLA